MLLGSTQILSKATRKSSQLIQKSPSFRGSYPTSCATSGWSSQSLEPSHQSPFQPGVTTPSAKHSASPCGFRSNTNRIVRSEKDDQRASTSSHFSPGHVQCITEPLESTKRSSSLPPRRE